MKGKHEKNSGWRKLLVLSLVVMMAVMFMPASALADGTDGGTQSAASASQSVDKTNTGGEDTGTASAEQKTEEKEINQGAADAVQTSSEQQNQLTAAGSGSETAKETAENSSSDVPQYLKTQLENECKAAFDSDDEASIGGTPYKTIGKALSAAKDGDTITLLRDIDRNFEIAAFSETDTKKTVHSIDKGGIDIPSDKNITLNLNAHQVMTSTENGHRYSIKVASGSTVRIVNQPTSARQAKLGTMDSNDVQETQKEVKGEAVLSSGIINEGTVTLDNTQGKIYLNNDNGYSFYNRGTLILQGDYSTGYPPALSWLRLTLNIIEQTKDAKVSFADGFDADRLSFQLPDEVLSELNDGTPTKSVRYTLVDQGTERVWGLINSNSSSISGLTNENVQKKTINDEKSMILYLKGTDPEDKPDQPDKKDYRRVYLNGKTGIDNLNNQGLDRGLESDKPVKTFAEAKRVYYEAKKEHYPIVKIEIDGTVTVGASEETWNSSNAGNTDTMKDNNIQSSGVSPAAGDDLIKRSAISGDAENSDVKSADTSDNDNSADSNTITIVRGRGFNGYLVKVPKSSTLTLENIILDGNQDNASSTEKSLIDSEGGTLNIKEGAVLQNNKLTKLGYFEACGGAVHASGGIVNMTGGIIQNNTANYGGGIYAGNGAVLNMSGGSIQNNHAVDGTSSKESGYAAGGGVVLYQGNTIMKFTDGSIVNNSSENMGGGISVGTGVAGNGPETLNMSGGTVDGNSAGSGGGGIFVQAGYSNAIGCAKITRGIISGNRMTGKGKGNSSFGGGGIYVNGYPNIYTGFQKGELHLKNALIYENSAVKAGGGYASCPCSETHIYVTNGAAIYKNKSAEAEDLYILASNAYGVHSGSPAYTISESMLGGNPYHWKYDDNQEVPMNKLSGTLNALWNESLGFHTDETADQEAATRAEVKIYGNTSATRGGGIGSNGTVYIGTEDVMKVQAQKKWNDASAIKHDSIKVKLYRSTGTETSEKVYIGYITLSPDKDGNWTNKADFGHLPKKDADGNAYNYTVEEEPVSGYTATVTQDPSLDENSRSFTIANTPTPTPTPTPSPTYRHVTVQKTWTLDDGKTRPDSIQVQLMKNGVAYGSPVTLNDANSWTFTWNNLDNDGSQWTVNEVLVPQGFTESQKTTEESDGLKVVINNDDQPTKPNKPTNPTKPNKPINPKTPNKPTNPKTPGKRNTSVTPKTPAIHRAVVNTSSVPASSAPRTSDSTRLGTLLIVFGGAAAALAAVLVLKRKENE